MNEGYSICLNTWALDKEIKNELGLLLIISGLTAKCGYCHATNTYFAELFETTEISISRKIKKLEDKNYISIEYEKRGSQIISRKIRLTNLLTDHYQNCYSTVNKNVKENNTSINNTKEINNNKLLFTKKSFQKPTFEEVKAYCTERNNNIDAQLFIDFYESNGWKVGKNAMKDWKACIRTWERNNKNTHLDWQSQKMKQQEEAGRKFLEGYCD